MVQTEEILTMFDPKELGELAPVQTGTETGPWQQEVGKLQLFVEMLRSGLFTEAAGMYVDALATSRTTDPGEAPFVSGQIVQAFAADAKQNKPQHAEVAAGLVQALVPETDSSQDSTTSLYR